MNYTNCGKVSSVVAVMTFLASHSWLCGAPLTNGSFEDAPPMRFGSAIEVFVGESLIAWEVGGNAEAVDLHLGPYGELIPFGAFEGMHYLVFNGGHKVAGVFIEQIFDSQVGSEYEVTFSVARIGGGSGAVRMSCGIYSSSHTLLGSLEIEPELHESGGWLEPASLTFVATTPLTTIRFTDTSLATQDTDILLDAVKVENISPETSLALYPGVEVTGKVGSTYRVEYRDGLDEAAPWLELKTIRLGTTSELVFDPAGLNETPRFYRAVEVQAP